MMANPWIAALIAVMAWWASTGCILMRVRHADIAPRSGEQHLYSVLLGLPLLVGGVLGVQASLGAAAASVGAAYLGFFSALAIWGWVELAFLSGVVTGPNRTVCPPDARGPERFIRACGTIAWHEMALIGLLFALAVMSRGAEHPTALWTFALLFAARISAKLNLFFGVPWINIDFLPRPLAHLPSHFRVARMNWLFPVSVSGLGIAMCAFVNRMLTAPHDGASTAFALLAAMTALALLEHVFMVLPLHDARLWRWMMPATKTETEHRLPQD